jgi:hypothetical protein
MDWFHNVIRVHRSTATTRPFKRALRSLPISLVATLGLVAVSVSTYADNDRDGGQHWVATWATAPATFFVYVAPVPPAPPGPPTTFAPAVDVLAPSDTVVVCAFGDSITDGTHTTLNINDRWANTLSRRLHDAYGNKVSIVNEAIGGNRVVNPVVANATSAPLRSTGSIATCWACRD